MGSDEEPAAQPHHGIPEHSREEVVEVASSSAHFFGGQELRATTLPMLKVPSEVPVIVSEGSTHYPVLVSLSFVFTIALAILIIP